MNLVKDPWIPVVLPNGSSAPASLRSLYERGEEIRDLAVNPPQRIALMRLLICITQAALDGPEDEEEWVDGKPRIIPESLAYLDKWQDRFELYGKHPFLQLAGLEVDEGKDKPADFIDLRLATGNNPTLFDQGSNGRGRRFCDAEKALALLTFMNFSTGGKVGQSIWKGQKHSDATFAAPAIKYAHTFVCGSEIVDTLYRNLLTKGSGPAAIEDLPNVQWGKPIWEAQPTADSDSAAFDNACCTYLGRLVPFSRLVLLDYRGDTCRCIVGPLPKGRRIDHLPAYREPWATIRQNRKGEDYYLPLRSEKHMWRELGGILAVSATTHGNCRCAMPLARFANMAGDAGVDVWVGGLEVGDQAAKVSDTLEWVFHIPAGLLHSIQMSRYESGVQKASEAEAALGAACKKYVTATGQAAALGAKARAQFWGMLDTQHGRLIDAGNDMDAILDRVWYPIVRDAMEAAYAFACPHTTPRQIEAFAQGTKALKLNKFGDMPRSEAVCVHGEDQGEEKGG